MRTLSLLIVVALLTATPALAQKNPGPPKEKPEETSEPAEIPPTAEAVEARAAATYPDDCFAFQDQDQATYDEQTEIFDLPFRYEYEDPANPDHHLWLYKVFCGAGAYNLIHVYFKWQPGYGLSPVSFAMPIWDDPYMEGSVAPLAGAEVNDLAITGWMSSPLLINSSFDPATRTIHSNSYFRGLGDASSQGAWVQEQADFVLKTFDLDVVYDEQVNLQRIVDYTATN